MEALGTLTFLFQGEHQALNTDLTLSVLSHFSTKDQNKSFFPLPSPCRSLLSLFPESQPHFLKKKDFLPSFFTLSSFRRPPFPFILHGFYSHIWRGFHVIASKCRHGCNSKGCCVLARHLGAVVGGTSLAHRER